MELEKSNSPRLKNFYATTPPNPKGLGGIARPVEPYVVVVPIGASE
jgi:hypothetical protein